MKTAVIFVLYKTPESEVARLRQEALGLGLPGTTVYFIDNTGTGKGYAQGVNEGLKKGLEEGADYFLVCNPDISFEGLNARVILEGARHFDIWGYAMRQNNTVYYGGQIDRWRMSGGLSQVKPRKRFVSADFVTGSLMVMTRRAVEETGLLDESYFMYYEDVDYCMRARQRGLRIGIDADHSYDHFELSVTNPDKDYHLAKNRVRFLLKYGSLTQKLREAVRAPLTVWEERKLLWDTLRRSAFIRNFFSLNLSAFFGKALNFVLFIVLIRHLPVKDYGLYTLVWAHVSILSPLVDFGTTSYGMVYLPREKEKRAISLFSLRFVLALVIFVLTVLLAFVFRYDSRVIFLITLVSFVIFFNMTSGTYFIFTSVREEMTKTAFISIAANTVMTAGLIAAVLLYGDIRHLFLTVSFFYLAYSVMYYFLLKKLVPGLRIILNPKEWLEIIRKSYVFVLISLFAGIYFKIDVFVLNTLKGTADVGIYSSGYKFFEAMILLASSYNTLSAPSFSKTAFSQKKRLPAKIGKHILFLAVIGLAVVAVTEIFGSLFLPVILKGNYFQAVGVVKIVIWAIPFILFNSVFLNLLYASELSFVAVFLFIAVSVLNLVLNLIFVPRFSYMASSYITVFSEIANLAMLLVAVFAVYRKKIFYD